MVFVAWLGWRAILFIRLLAKPVRDAAKPLIDPLNAHIDTTLRRSGLGKLADVSNRIQSGIEGAMDESQRRIDRRHNK